MRLIDVDKLKKDLESVTLSNGTLLNTNTVLLLLDKYPTAYDVDEVIKRLKKLRDCKYLTGITNDAYEFGACDALNDVIKIIKAGGANE